MSDDDDLTGQIQRAIGDAISSILAQYERGFVIKWLTLVESSDAEGKRGLWALTSDDVMAWDTVGMLQHALHLELAQTIRGDED